MLVPPRCFSYKIYVQLPQEESVAILSSKDNLRVYSYILPNICLGVLWSRHDN